MTADPRIDAYVAKSQEFSRPILEYIRGVVRDAVPEAEETIKWGMPHFTIDGAILCSMAAFKQHCAFYLRHGPAVLGESYSDEAMGSFGRITSLKDLPARRTLVPQLRKAAALVREAQASKLAAKKSGTAAKKAAPARKVARAAKVPEDLAAALAMRKHAKARATFDGFPPSHRREYIEWITEAKRPETRERRLAQSLEWLAEGKQRNWKYVK